LAKGSNIFNRSLEEVYSASVKALEECGFAIKEKTSNSIKASSGFSIWSWGEDIEVRLSSKPYGTEVEVTSEASQIFDWGKSEENISSFFMKLTKCLDE